MIQLTKIESISLFESRLSEKNIPDLIEKVLLNYPPPQELSVVFDLDTEPQIPGMTRPQAGAEQKSITPPMKRKDCFLGDE